MVQTSIVIPSRNEIFLTPTIKDLLAKARGEIEIIVVLEGYWPQEFFIKYFEKYDELVDDKRVHYIHSAKPRGMRGAINAGVAIAKGKYIMKCDAHCMFDEGFDVKLAADLEPNWIAVPRRYSLDGDAWKCKEKKAIDYMYLCAPTDPNDFGGPSLHGRTWSAKQNDASLKEVLIDDLMSAQGSCWFMHRDYFHALDLEDEINYGTFCFEFQEVGLNCWLSGGRVIRNKKTWYAHLHKGRKYGRGYPLGKSQLRKGAAHSNKFMDGKNWRGQDRDIRWLINKFWPVPTWTEESTRLVFHRKKGGSGQIRGLQMAKHLQARLNPEWSYDFDVHVWVKQCPPDDFPKNSYLDIIDEPRRLGWLLKHPECGVISSSVTAHEYLKEKLGRDDIVLIPQHHCNFERARRKSGKLKVAGVAGGPGAIQCDVEELKQTLKDLGLEFRWQQRFRNPDEVVKFYEGLDVQIVWRMMDRPLKNPLKIVNAMSFGIPTVGYPEIGYKEVEGYYWSVETMDELKAAIRELRKGFDADRLIKKAEEYHIDNIAPLYKKLLLKT